MPTVKQQIAKYLQEHPEGATDSELHKGLGLKHHPQASQACHQLELEGLVKRVSLSGANIRNYWQGAVFEGHVATGTNTSTVKDQISRYLQDHMEGATDSELYKELGLKYLPQANQACRQLEFEGLVKRIKPPGKSITNYWHETVIKDHVAGSEQAVAKDSHEAWYWEGNVQSMVVRYLAANGYDILRVCDTASRERGKDIEARSAGRPLWVTVKGYPEETPRTRPQIQAGHWFSGALFDIVCWRGEDAEVELALAIPDFPRYRNLAQRIAWVKSSARFCLLWVGEDGNVQIER